MSEGCAGGLSYLGFKKGAVPLRSSNRREAVAVSRKVVLCVWANYSSLLRLHPSMLKSTSDIWIEPPQCQSHSLAALNSSKHC